MNEIIIEDDTQYKIEFDCFKSKVICVGSVVKDVDKADVCVELLRHYKSIGKKVAVVMNKSFYSLFGLPYIDFDKIISHGIDYMISSIRKIFYQLAKTNDVIICYVPGSLISYNGRIMNDSGVYAYILSEVIKINSLICCIPINPNSAIYYKNIEKVISDKFGIKETFFHVSNFFPLHTYNNNTRIIEGTYLIDEEYKEYFENYVPNLKNVGNILLNNKVIS